MFIPITFRLPKLPGPRSVFVPAEPSPYPMNIEESTTPLSPLKASMSPSRSVSDSPWPSPSKSPSPKPKP